jgi:hypothetical protein
MLKKNTVLILGAGASLPYGFPLGSSLLAKIAANIETRIESLVSNDHRLSGERKSELIHNAELLKNKILELNPESIDLLLSRWPSLEEIGKLAILMEILEAETDSKQVISATKPGLWYPSFFHKMSDDVTCEEEIDLLYENKVAVITFNYDRSFEFKLRHLILNFVETKNKEKLSAYFESIPILHVYGKIGEPFKEDDPTFCKYGQKYNFDLLSKLAMNIDVMYSSREKQTQEKIKELLASARQVLFLGFGFHSSNLEKIHFKRPSSSATLTDYFGTAIGIPNKRQEELKNKFNAGFFDREIRTTVNNTVEFRNSECADLIKDLL